MIADGGCGILYGWELVALAPTGNDSPDELLTTPLWGLRGNIQNYCRSFDVFWLTSFDSTLNFDLSLSQFSFVLETTGKKIFMKGYRGRSIIFRYLQRLLNIGTGICVALVSFVISTQCRRCCCFALTSLLFFEISLLGSNALQLQFLEYAICRKLWIEFMWVTKEIWWWQKRNTKTTKAQKNKDGNLRRKITTALKWKKGEF